MTQTTPVQVGTSGTSTLWSDWAAISVAQNTVCGIRSDSSAWCWGSGAYGERGDGTTTSTVTTPVQVGTSGTSTLWSDWESLECGGYGCCGIRTDGSAWCWGWEVAGGRTGDGTTSGYATVPARVGTSGTNTLWSDWAAISTSWYHSCGVRDDGSAWCWGNAHYGKLGNGDATNHHSTPVAVDRTDAVAHKTAYTGNIKGGSSPWTALSSVSLKDGETLLVCMTTLGTITGVTWNGQAMSQDAAHTGSTPKTYIYSLPNATAGTGDVVVNLTGTITAGLVGSIVSGMLTSPFDKSSGNAGSGTIQSSGSTATTAQADEFLYGCMGLNGPFDDAWGTWDNGFFVYTMAGTLGQGATSNVAVHAGYKRVTATGSYAASKSGANRSWAGVIATYKTVSQTTGLTWSTANGSGGGGSFACENPTGVPGMMLYDTTKNVLIYCDGTNWTAAGPNPGNGGSGCSSPSGQAGMVVYDDTNDVMTYCDGANWVGIGK